jgi:hypothetical protein
MPGQMALRWVTTPDGGQIGVVYTPLAELSHGDLYLLDEICKAISVDEAQAGPAVDTLPAWIGVSFPMAAGWQILGPDGRGGPGFWLQNVEEDRPVWAIGVFRRLLERWPDRPNLLRVESRRLGWSGEHRSYYREDGAFVDELRRSDRDRSASVIASVRIVAMPPDRAVVLYVLSAPDHARRANAAADQLVETLEFVADASD